MGGVDAIIFTAGIGEHDAGVRKAVMDAFKFLGVEPDYEANEENGEHFITKPGSKVKAMVIPTNEELRLNVMLFSLTNIISFYSLILLVCATIGESQGMFWDSTGVDPH